MQEKMQQLQQQLEASQKASSPPLVARTEQKRAELKPNAPRVTPAKSTAAAQKAKNRAGKVLLLTGRSRRKLIAMV